MKNFNPNFDPLASPAVAISPPLIPTLRPSLAEAEKIYEEHVLDISDKEKVQFHPKAHFRNDLGMDSLDMVELIMYCEKDFRITLKDHEWQSLKRVGELFKLIEKKMAFQY